MLVVFNTKLLPIKLGECVVIVTVVVAYVQGSARSPISGKVHSMYYKHTN